MKKIVLLGISALTFGFAAAQANQEPATPAPAAQTSKAKIEFNRSTSNLRHCTWWDHIPLFRRTAAAAR